MQPVIGFVRVLDGVVGRARCGHETPVRGVIVPKWVECAKCRK
jgi:hypothetical protein